MKKLILLLLFTCGVSHAALTASVPYAWPTAAFLKLQGYSGTCTIVVSTDPTFTSPATIPDFNGTEYSGASTDTGRTDTDPVNDVGIPGTRWVVVGHNDHDRALTPNTAYYGSVSGCGTATFAFVTPTIPSGDSIQIPVPFDATQPWNYAYPSVVNASSTHSWVTDPIWGTQLMAVNQPGDRTWRTGANGVSIPPPSGYNTMNYSSCSGWSGLTQPFPTTSVGATVGTTASCDVYGYTAATENLTGYMGESIDDVGAVLFDTASMRDGTNNKYTVCVIENPSLSGNAACIGAPITITVSNSSFAAHSSGNTNDSDGAYPSNFPTPFLNGWGVTSPLGPDHNNISGSGLSCVSSACSLGSTPSAGFPYGSQSNGHFPSTMVAGQKIYISGIPAALACNNVCTLSSYTDQGHITIVESLTTSNQSFTVYMWGLRIAKTTATGTLTVGIGYKVAGSVAVGQSGGQFWTCGAPFVSGDGHPGKLCETPDVTNTDLGYALYFIPTDGSTAVRAVYNGNIQPYNSTCYPGLPDGQPFYPDFPDPNAFLWPQLQPDATNGKLWYAGQKNDQYPTKTVSLYSLLYTGDATTDHDNNGAYAYTYQNVGPMSGSGGCGDWQITNLTPPSTGMTIAGQIDASPALTAKFNTPVPINGDTSYGGAWVLSGITTDYAFFNLEYDAPDAGPAWIATVNLNASKGAVGTVTSLIHTLDGTGTAGYYGGLRWGTLHCLYPTAVSDTLQICANQLNTGSASYLFGGPFQLSVLKVLEADGVTWNSNTALPWPIDTSYYTSCSSSLINGCASQYAQSPMSYASNQFVTLLLAGDSTGHAACGITPTSYELSTWTCSWNGSYSAPIPLVPGDNIVDAGQVTLGDSEHLQLVSWVYNSGLGGIVALFRRNAIYDYCSALQPAPTVYPGTSISTSAQPAAQLEHSNGWTPQMNPAKINGCSSEILYYSLNTNTGAELGPSLQGHGSLTGGPTAGTYSFVGSNVLKYNQPYPAILGLPVTYSSLFGPSWLGTSLTAGLQQGYTNAQGDTVVTMNDDNSLNPEIGLGPENHANSIGTVTLTNITGNIYTLTTLGSTLSAANYKKQFLNGWAGRKLLGEYSGPSSVSGFSSEPDHFCYAYFAGECHAGSSANTLYVNEPGAYPAAGGSTSCNAGESFLLAPCVVLGLPNGGGIRQNQILGPDPTGKFSRTLSYALTAPGIQYPYSQFTAISPNIGLVAPHHVPGWSTMAFMVNIPPWQTDGLDRTQYIQTPIRCPVGLAYCRVAFGYSIFIGANTSPVGNLWPTPRQEEGVTSTNVVPFAFKSESSTATGGCTLGCTVGVPRLPDRLGWYRIDRSADDSTWVSGDTLPLP